MNALTSLGTRDRRAIRIGMMIMASALAVVGLVGPYRTALEDGRDRLAAERALLGRERALVDAAADYQAAGIAARRAVSIRTPRLFDGDPTLAAGALARYAAERATLSSVLLETTVARPDSGGDGGLIAVRVEIRAIGDVEGVLRFLRFLEEGPRLVHVERLSLEGRQRFGAEAGDDVQVVAVGATLAGFVVNARTPGAGEVE